MVERERASKRLLVGEEGLEQAGLGWEPTGQQVTGEGQLEGRGTGGCQANKDRPRTAGPCPWLTPSSGPRGTAGNIE